MLSILPSLLFLAPFSAFLIRIALGVVFGYAALRHFENTDAVVRALAILEGALAIMLVVGAWTQVMALLGGLLIGAWFWFPQLRTVALGTVLLSLALSLTLLITGAGPFAFDLPL